ncbi:MAG: twin-arginine translocation signal domain-containing protein [Chthoniobacter sp.]
MPYRPHSRRDFLKTASAATLGALAAGAPRLFAEPEEKIVPTAGLCDRVVDGRGHGAHGDLRPEALRAF